MPGAYPGFKEGGVKCTCIYNNYSARNIFGATLTFGHMNTLVHSYIVV